MLQNSEMMCYEAKTYQNFYGSLGFTGIRSSKWIQEQNIDTMHELKIFFKYFQVKSSYFQDPLLFFNFHD